MAKKHESTIIIFTKQRSNAQTNEQTTVPAFVILKENVALISVVCEYRCCFPHGCWWCWWCCYCLGFGKDGFGVVSAAVANDGGGVVAAAVVVIGFAVVVAVVNAIDANAADAVAR